MPPFVPLPGSRRNAWRGGRRGLRTPIPFCASHLRILSDLTVIVGHVTLFLHRGTATDDLADGLARLLGQPLADPFAQEVVAVPARGVERWLAQRLSHRLGAAPGRSDGVAAGIRFLTPHSLVALVLGLDRDDPWRPEQLAWTVLAAIDDALGEPWARVLAAHLGEDRALSQAERELRRGRRFAVARRLAGLFHAYAQQRPAILSDWREGGSGDGLGGVVADDLAWQPPLWRRVLDRVDAPPPDVRHAAVLERLRTGGGAGHRGADGGALDLPGRLSLFGHTRIARSEIEVLTALGQHRDVHLWLPQASPAAWEHLAPIVATGPIPRADDDSALLVRHPLLASLGRDARELQRTLALTGARDEPVPGAAEHEQAPRTLLGWLQHDLRGDHAPSAEEIAVRRLAADDRSLQIHACHGRGRQVDVVRDVLTGLLQDDPGLEPRDVLLMCPDIDAYAPLIHAGFGLGEVVRTARDLDPAAAHPAHGLRVSLADRAPQQTNPLLALAAELVALAGGRVTAGEVLDLAHSAPVRRRFRLDDDDLDRLTTWADDAAVRWGLDAEHRASYDLRAIAQNTWRSGIDRIVVGAAVDGEEVTHVGQVLALDDLDSGDIDLAGRLAELLQRLGSTVRRLQACRGADEWMTTLRQGVLALTDTPARDAWQVTGLARELSRIQAAAAQPAGATTLRLADVSALLDDHRSGRPTRSNFRTGTLTVCTMVPMRSVPHRVICLVGLDDGAFPRTTTPDGDDALTRRSVTGERDGRAEDRQLLLDAVLAARQTLVITYTGADEHTGADRPPAVPLGELIDAARVTASGPAVERLVTRHPLQPYDPRNLGAPDPAGGPALLAGGAPFSRDPVALAGGRALVADRREVAALLEAPLAAAPGDDVDVQSLRRFLLNPVGVFLRDRLGILLPEEPEEPAEGIPLELDGLGRWQVGDRLLTGLLAGRDIDDLRRAEVWRGELPPHQLGETVLDAEARKALALAGAARGQLRLSDPAQPVLRESLDIDVALPSGRRLVGTLDGIIHTFGPPSALTITYSQLAARQRLESWLKALTLAAAGHPLSSSHVIGHRRARGSTGWAPVPFRIYHGPLDERAAGELLDQLVDIRERGLREPLPLPPKTARAWADAFLERGSVAHADEKARYAWETDEFKGIPGEQDAPAHVLAFGERAPLAALLGVPGPDEEWASGVPSRLGQLALRVWGPLTRHEGEARL